METLSTKVPPSMKKRIEQYAESIGETRSTAIRELLQTGLDADDDTTDTAPPWYIAQLLGWVLFAAAFVDVPQQIGYLGAAIVLATILDHRLSLTDRLT